MRFKSLNAILATAGLASSVLLMTAGAALAQTVSLTAGSTQALLPDGQSVPMWGYTCGAVVQGTTGTTSCAAANPKAAANWSPVVITVPPGPLTISLTNSLPALVAETSLVIVGQLGGGAGSGGLGTSATSDASPTHGPQSATWPIVGDTTGPQFTPPGQAPRVRSFSTPAKHTTPATLTWTNLKPGTYLIESGTYPSIQGAMGLYGVLVVTTPPLADGSTAGTAYGTPGAAGAVSYNAEIPLVLSEIDPVQNAAVALAVTLSGFTETKVWSGQPGGCGNPATLPVTGNCYPPAVNYDPRYYLINGVSLDKTALANSLFNTAPAVIPTTATGNKILVRFVNAGLRMHVPSIVGAQTGQASTPFSGFSLIAEDGNVLPGTPRIQSEVFLAAGKTYDVMINAPAATTPAPLPVFDRQLSLSTSNHRDGGMQAYIGVNGATTAASIGAAPTANPDHYYLPVTGAGLTISDPAQGVLANDIGVSGAAVQSAVTGLTLHADGTFVYAGATSTSFTYCGNGSATLCALVTIDACTGACVAATPTAGSGSFTSNIASRLQIAPPGVLQFANGMGHPVTATIGSTITGGTVTLNPDGSFIAVPSASGTPMSFTYNAVNSQQTSSAAPGTITVNFLPGSGLHVNVLDAPSTLPTATGAPGTPVAITDYRWIIEEDRTFVIDPTQVNNGVACTSTGVPIGCIPGLLPVPSLGTNFHTSYMPVVASGCVGIAACEDGQTVINPADGSHNATVCDIGNGQCRNDGSTQQVAVDPSQVHLDPLKRYYISILPGDAGNPFSAGAGAPSNGSGSLTQNGKSVKVTPQGGVGGIVVGDTVNISANIPSANGVCTVTSVAANGTFYVCTTAIASTKVLSGVATYTHQFSIAEDCPSGPGGPDFAPPHGATAGGTCGHGMGGAPIKAGQSSVDVKLEETPFGTTKVAVFVFEDDWPLNGENDAGGGVDALALHEVGLSGFEIRLFDDAGGSGDATGQMTYDMFNYPLSNSLAGTIDPQHPGNDACPITTNGDGLVGMIVTCPHFESDGVTVSPLEGQAVIANLMPGRYGVQANEGSDRIARGEEWLQTNTLDGQKAHDSFIKVGGPAYFQEFGPGGYHVLVGFANPKIINDRGTNPKNPDYVCGAGTSCTNTISGTVTTARMSRTPDQRLYSSGDRSSLGFTQCYASLGDPDGEDFAFVKCDSDGKFSFNNIPDGSWRITLFDQWNDQIVDGLSTPVAVNHLDPKRHVLDMGQIPVQQWHTNIYTRSYFDTNGDGVSNVDSNGNPTEPGLALLPTNIRFRDGSYSNFNNTDLNGYAGFNEIFPLFNWYVIETDTTRFKQTGVHVVYDAGGPADGNGGGPGGVSSNIAAGFANTNEAFPVPSTLRNPGTVYCVDADCKLDNLLTHPNGGGAGGSTGRIDPPSVTAEGWQGFIGENEFVEFGKKLFATGENGGIHGEVTYASTRPFDDPSLLLHTSWTPNVPNVTINLYREDTAADGTKSLTLVDTTKTTSWDDWAQGVRADNGNRNMNCPGQDPTSLYFYTLQNSPMGLNPSAPQPDGARYKCYDGFAQFNQVQPAPYDGYYHFPSVTATDPATGKPTPTGTNCTGCVPNAASPTTDWDHNAPMLPAGRYVVEMIVPPGYELVKEEDKNILIGDNYIAPVTQQFGGLGSIFILPDQAAVTSSYNANNAVNPTSDLGSVTYARHEGDTGSVETFWPCVGQSRIVPDFISLFPHSAETAPFAGATRNLCDRKEVILEDQTAPLAKFWVFSSTHVAAHFTGIILNDFTSEFDPFSPQYGEKFAVPNVPISFKDFTGVEVSRAYSDQWGMFNGLQYSTWEVNPPNPTGYAPTMMVTCMNDPGPILDPAGSGKMVQDPLYNPAYSQFCYEIPFMPGQTQYMDTPVVPTAAFADRYNLPDCAYPDATPAVARVDGDGVGPYVSAAGHTITITALGDQIVPNHGYAGPQATTAPFNQKTIKRHYGFGTHGPGTVTIGGVTAPLASGTSWSDTTLTVTVPTTVPQCGEVQLGAGAGVKCGELVITASAADGSKSSIDAVTVTVGAPGGKSPTYVTAENGANNAIQTALDAAAPGDLIIVGPPAGVTAPTTFYEMLLMWKPVRLQGVGAATVIVNANTHPSGKIDPWRRQAVCLFGLALDGGFISATHPYDPNGKYSCSTAMQATVDPIPLEPLVGWDPTLNGNIAELLQEPTLLGAYEGAAITVLAKGVRNIPNTPAGAPDPNCSANGICVPLTASTTDCAYKSNFLCQPSRIDGVSFTNSSQGGGGIFVHGWNHNLEVANNRVYSNAGTLSGGITVGQPETADGTVNAQGQVDPFGYYKNVNVHNNYVTENAAYGDELNSTTPMAAGGVTICTGADNYKFNHNWVCGNISTGDGGGFAHFGLSYNGNISNNWFVFNQSTNPTIPTNGGGVLISGAPPDGPACENAAVDIDCPPSLSDGAGPGLVIDANLIMGNTAESGSGGGLRLQSVNGTEVAPNARNSGRWYDVTVTNNIIANNVAGWDGGGVSLVDALNVKFINNTVMSNDSTASAGVLFNTLGAPDANTPPPGCDPTIDPDCVHSQVLQSNPLPAGLVTMQNTPNMTSSLGSLTLTCPNGLAGCKTFSNPLLVNNVFWQNRSFHIVVGGLGAGTLNQQNTVTLHPTLNQTATGACMTTPVAGTGPLLYWDIGVRGDSSPTPGSSAAGNTGPKLAPRFSIIDNGPTGTILYPSANNLGGSNPLVVSQYCDGSRVPPEDGGLGFDVPPGISDATLPNPVFNLTPSATVDEGNNWINLSYGPLSLTNPATISAPGTAVPALGNYAITSGSPAKDVGTTSGAPPRDFFGTLRPQGTGIDIGAVEVVGSVVAPAVTLAVAPGSSAAFGNVTVPRTAANAPTQDFRLSNTGPTTFTIGTITVGPAPFTRVNGGVTGNCGATLAAGANCTIRVRFQPTVAGPQSTGAVTVSGTGPGGIAATVTGSPLTVTGTGVASVITFALQSGATPGVQLTFIGALATLDFGTQTNTASGTLVLTNTGTTTVTWGGGNAVTGSRFAKGADSCAGASGLGAGKSCTITVTFSPNNTSVRAGTLTVRDNANGNPQTVMLMGN